MQATPATLARRLGAILYDSLLIIALWMITVLVLVVAVGEAVSGVGLRLLLIAEAVGFYIFFWLRAGQTLGMLAWRLRVVTPNGADIGWQQACIRAITACASAALLGLGYLWMLIDREQMTWHDRASGSKALSANEASWYLPSLSVKNVNMKNDNQSGVFSLNAPRILGLSLSPDWRTSNCSASSRPSRPK